MDNQILCKYCNTRAINTDNQPAYKLQVCNFCYDFKPSKYPTKLTMTPDFYFHYCPFCEEITDSWTETVYLAHMYGLQRCDKETCKTSCNDTVREIIGDDIYNLMKQKNINVKRSSGIIEDNWYIDEKDCLPNLMPNSLLNASQDVDDNDDNHTVVRCYRQDGTSDDPDKRISKSVKVTDLLEYNKK